MPVLVREQQGSTEAGLQGKFIVSDHVGCRACRAHTYTNVYVQPEILLLADRGDFRQRIERPEHRRAASGVHEERQVSLTPRLRYGSLQFARFHVAQLVRLHLSRRFFFFFFSRARLHVN